MINIQIPKDPRDFQPKFVGPFTERQTICVAAAVVIVFAGIWIEQHILKLPAISLIPPLIPAMIPLFMGFSEPLFKMQPEVYFKTVFHNMVKIPKHRSFKTQNYYKLLEDMRTEEELEEEENAPKKKGMSARELRRFEASLPEELHAYK